jgi:YVTN family beta-propeller protein
LFLRLSMKQLMVRALVCLATFLACVVPVAPLAAQSATYSVLRTVPLGGDGGWDYLYADPEMHRLYISRSTHFTVVDLQSGKVAGEIPDTPGAHGVALVPSLGIGFTSNGREATSSVFDLKTLKVSEKIKTGEGPDSILYDPFSGHVVTMNGRARSVSVIDPKTRKMVATIPLSGRPEAPVADEKGRIYVNLEDKNLIAVIDSSANRIIAEWPLPGCEGPSGLDMDREIGHLFTACDNKVMAIVDAKTGKVIGTVPTGSGTDGLSYDPRNKVAVASNGEGTMSFVGRRDGKYALLQTVATRKGARTLTFDPSTGEFLTVTADFGPAPKPTAENPRGRPPILPNSFVMIAVGKK